MKNTHNKSDIALLRQKAEELLKKKSAGTASPFSEVESIRLIHELEVHQVELEMQNDELQRARAIAEVANDKYIRLYDFAPSGYFTLSDKGEIIELNLSGAKMLGKDRQHLKNSLLGFFVSEETKPIFNRFLEKAFNGKVKESCDVTLLQDGNLPMYGHLTGIVYENGEQCLVTMVDITERKQAEEAIKLKNEQLIHANAEKDKFFSIISHDLRGPFNGFLGLSNLMAEESSDLTQDEIQKMAGAMRDSAVNLFRLLENLLEWSRLQRGITSFEPGPFLLMPMIAESMHPVIDLADKKGVEIRYEIQADLEVFADQYMLSSTIRNLASNAVKFTLKGGKVTIAAKSVPGHSVEISVSDTGIGMNPEMVHDLFRLDTKTNRRGTENEPSSGLGLLLCKDFVEKHGGKLWVESEEGKGSVFYVTIPSNAEELMKTVISNSVLNEEKEVQIKRMKILIAEDDEISASLISAMVDKYSHNILHVKTGVDAIHACRNNPDIDLVLMDINLPGLDGFEATRQIRQFNNDMVIIAQTAFSLKFDRVMAIEAGCNDYISKPISISELKGLIRKYFTV